MKIIADTNIVFSTLLNTSSRIGDLLLNSDKIFEFYTCNLLKEEITEHKDKLLKISGYTENHFDTLCQIVFAKINFYLRRHYSFRVLAISAANSA